MAAGVVNGLVHAYIEQEAEMRMAGTDEATVRLNQELAELKAQIGQQDAGIAGDVMKSEGLITRVISQLNARFQSFDTTPPCAASLL